MLLTLSNLMSFDSQSSRAIKSGWITLSHSNSVAQEGTKRSAGWKIADAQQSCLRVNRCRKLISGFIPGGP